MNDKRGTTLRLGDAELEVRWYADPPDGFDALTAEPRLLRIYGFPPRPDPQSQPELRAGWNRAVSRIRLRARPRFRVEPERFHGRRPHPAIEGPDISTNWAGSVVQPPAGRAWQWVQGEWTVPDCASPGGQDGQFYSAAWVGIDGGLGRAGSTDLVQAGTESDSLTGETTSFYLWWEWVPLPQVTILDFPVSGGDLITSLICVESDGSGVFAGFFLLNETNGVFTAFSVRKPEEAQFVGDTAEWIVEAPTLSSIFGNGTVLPLTDFGAVYFDEAYAGTADNDIVSCGDPASTQMFLFGQVSNQLLAAPVLENQQCMKVTRSDPDDAD